MGAPLKIDFTLIFVSLLRHHLRIFSEERTEVAFMGRILFVGGLVCMALGLVARPAGDRQPARPPVGSCNVLIKSMVDIRIHAVPGYESFEKIRVAHQAGTG